MWDWAELGYLEQRSAARLAETLRAAGFTIEMGVGGIPTAFVASYGSGEPVVGILAEYDALPAMAQDAAPERSATDHSASGHACGHNLFGAGSALAAIAVKEALVATGGAGTIKFFGCPAEEGGGGKVHLSRAGVFAGCDAILSWHPGDANFAIAAGNLANVSARFRYTGVAAHASVNPWSGRSALDGLMLTAHALDMLREHMPDGARIHYTVTRGGGAPNVVPADAELYLYARHANPDELRDLWKRVLACGEAGALGTGTTMAVTVVNSNYARLPNMPLAKLYDRHLRASGGIVYTPEEHAFAEKLHTTLPASARALGTERDIQPIMEKTTSGSSDVADVSWQAPTGEMNTACLVPGTPAHSWQVVAAGGMSIGEKGMVLAARVLALSAVDLLSDAALRAEVAADFERRKAGRTYQSLLPADAKPPLDYRANGGGEL